MRNTLALLAAALIAFVAGGWYLGWYRLQTAPSGDGHRQFNIDVNTKKISEDVRQGVSKGKEAVGEFITTKDGKPAQPAPANPQAQGSGWQVNVQSQGGGFTYQGEGLPQR